MALTKRLTSYATLLGFIIDKINTDVDVYPILHYIFYIICQLHFLKEQSSVVP